MRTIEVGIDDENETVGGQIETEHLASCVGYAVYMPQRKEAYVGHWNLEPYPPFYRLHDKDVSGKMFDSMDEEDGLRIFIFGGDGKKLANDLIKRFAGFLGSFQPHRPYEVNSSAPRVFCDMDSPTALRITGDDVVIVPYKKATGICIDTSTGRVRLKLDKVLDEKGRLRLNRYVDPRAEKE